MATNTTSVLLYLLLIGCGSDAQRPAAMQRPTTVAGEARVLLDTPIFYEVPEDNATRTIHTPMIRARIGGVDTLLILDTGASDSIFVSALGDAIGVERVPDEPGTDHAGAAVPTFAATTSVDMQLESLTIPLRRMLFIEGPAPFAEWGIGGIISPQLLHDNGWVVLDLAGRALRVLEGDEASIARAISEAHEGWGHASLARATPSGDSVRQIIINGSVDGMPARAMLNTGGAHTEVAPMLQNDAAADVDVDEVTTGRGVSGSDVRGRLGSEQLSCRFGSLELTTEDYVVREQTDAYDAQFGIDILRTDVLMLRAQPGTNAHWWRAPAVTTP